MCLKAPCMLRHFKTFLHRAQLSGPKAHDEDVEFSEVVKACLVDTATTCIKLFCLFMSESFLVCLYGYVNSNVRLFYFVWEVSKGVRYPHDGFKHRTWVFTCVQACLTWSYSYSMLMNLLVNQCSYAQCTGWTYHGALHVPTHTLLCKRDRCWKCAPSTRGLHFFEHQHRRSCDRRWRMVSAGKADWHIRVHGSMFASLSAWFEWSYDYTITVLQSYKATLQTPQE